MRGFATWPSNPLPGQYNARFNEADVSLVQRTCHWNTSLPVLPARVMCVHLLWLVLPEPRAVRHSRETRSLSSNSTGPYLKVGYGLSKGLGILLASTESYAEWTIGCDTSRDIIFTDDGVSGYHAKIVNEGSRWKLVDQMSTNGSFINDKKSIAGYLNSRDRIRIGKIECVLVLPPRELALPKKPPKTTVF